MKDSRSINKTKKFIFLQRRYSKFKERQKNASPYAAHAVCSRCRHYEHVREEAFCNGFGRSKRISDSAFYSTKEGYCTQYYSHEKECSE